MKDNKKSKKKSKDKDEKKKKSKKVKGKNKKKSKKVKDNKKKSKLTYIDSVYEPQEERLSFFARLWKSYQTWLRT